MACGYCNKAYNWTYADSCHRCNEKDNFICCNCYVCVECGKGEYDEVSDSEITENEKPIINKLKNKQIKKDMTDEELLKDKIEEMRQVNSNYKILATQLTKEKNEIELRLKIKENMAKKIKELEELKSKNKILVEKLEKEIGDMKI